MHFYLIIALQGFCIYHWYKNRREYYWIFLIIFLPVLGSVIYLITQVFNKRDAEKISSELTSIINPTKKIRDLEKVLSFSETFQNSVNLADAYFEIQDYVNARNYYQSALDNNHQMDVYVVIKIIVCAYHLKDFDQVIMLSKTIIDKEEFKKSQAQFYYGLALKELGHIEQAEEQLKILDQRYSNYTERLTLAKFLIEIDKKNEAFEILNEVYTESQHMTKINKRKYRTTILEVESLLNNK